jgi:hypothetical protein
LTYLNDKKNGFYHQKSETDKTSLASSATCYNSLVMANALEDFVAATDGGFRPTELILQIYNKDKSSGLLKNNPFSTSFICELAQQIMKTEDNYKNLDDSIRNDVQSTLDSKLAILFKLISEGNDYSNKDEKDSSILSSIVVEAGAVGIKPYPASAYLTQLVFRVLVAADYKKTVGDESWKKLTKLVSDWGRKEIQNQISRINANDRHGDPLALAYANRA